MLTITDGETLKGTAMQTIYNDKHTISSTQIPNTKIFAFIVVLVFNLLSHKVLFTNINNNRNC